MGKRLKCKTWPIFRYIPRGNIQIGNDVTIGYFITFEVEEKGKLTLGNSVNLTHNVIISVCEEVTIGNGTLIAENVSIRDADHGTKHNIPIGRQMQTSSSVSIGNDVWLGAGVAVLQGSKIEDGVIIGAHSVVTSSKTTSPYSIYAGVPIRLLSKR